MKTIRFTLLIALLVVTVMANPQNHQQLFIKDDGIELQEISLPFYLTAADNDFQSAVEAMTSPLLPNLQETGKDEMQNDTLYCLFDLPPWRFAVCDYRNTYSLLNDGITWINDTAGYIILDEGIYDAYYFAYNYNQTKNYLIIREQIPVTNNDTVIFWKAEADNIISFEGLDENNVPFVSMAGNYDIDLSVVFPDSLSQLPITVTLMNNNRLHCSNVSDNYILYASEFYETESRDKIYLAIFEPLYGVSHSQSIHNDPQDYVTQNMHFKLPDTLGKIRLVVQRGYKYKHPIGAWGYHIGGTGDYLSENEFSGKIHLSGYCLENFGHYFAFSFTNENHERVIFSEGFMLDNDSLLNSSFYVAPGYAKTASGDEMLIGTGPFYFNELADNFSRNGENYIFFYLLPVPYGMFNEQHMHAFFNEHYRIYDEQWQLLDEGKVIDYNIFSSEKDKLYFEVVSGDYTVAGKRGKATRTNFLDFSNGESTPPLVLSLQVRDSSRLPKENIHINEAVKINFSGKDNEKEGSGIYTFFRNKRIVIDSTKLFLKIQQEDDWREISVYNTYEDEDIGAYFESEPLFFGENETGYADIKVYVVDSAGNSTTHIVEPAFKIVDYYVDIDENRHSGASLALSCSPNPFRHDIKIEFELEEAEYINLEVLNLHGQPVQNLYSGKSNAGKYVFHWEGQTLSGKSVPEGLYFLRLKTSDLTVTQKIVKV